MPERQRVPQHPQQPNVRPPATTQQGPVWLPPPRTQRPSRPPQDQPSLQLRRRTAQERSGPEDQSARRCPTTHQARWSSQLQPGPACRAYPYRGHQQLARTLARRRSNPGAVDRLAVRRSVAWRLFPRTDRLQALQRRVQWKTTPPRSRPRAVVALSPRSASHASRAAPPPGRPLRPRPPTRIPQCAQVQSYRSDGASLVRLARWSSGPARGRSRPPRWSCPCATEPRPVGRPPRSGRVEIRLGPAWVRYRGTATPETDPPSTFHRPVLVPGRHRARSSRPRVTLPRYRPCPWWSPAAMPTSPTDPAFVPRRLPDPWSSSVASARVRPRAC
jgi:hypothetical protein